MATPAHCAYSFEVLHAALSNQPPPSLSRVEALWAQYTNTSTTPSPPAPLFVTWTTSRARLRGCIGTFTPQALGPGLRSYALSSALEDTRFAPIAAGEVGRLAVQVTVLGEFSAGTHDARAWTPGRHGVRIAFGVGGRRLGATYLPEVAEEQGWGCEEAVESLMQKAGWQGEGEWERVWDEGEGELVTYEGKKARLGAGEWRAWREWAGMR